jgi:hypothetical protein
MTQFELGNLVRYTNDITGFQFKGYVEEIIPYGGDFLLVLKSKDDEQFSAFASKCKISY